VNITDSSGRLSSGRDYLQTAFADLALIIGSQANFVTFVDPPLKQSISGTPAAARIHRSGTCDVWDAEGHPGERWDCGRQ
jgi:hypothetical protein